MRREEETQERLDHRNEEKYEISQSVCLQTLKGFADGAKGKQYPIYFLCKQFLRRKIGL